MNRPLLVTLSAALALAPMLAPAQVLVETIPERRARCNEALPLLPALEQKAREYEAGAAPIIAAIKANPRPWEDDASARYAGEGAKLLRLVEPTAKGCAVAAPEVGGRYAALVDQISATRIRVLSAIAGVESPL